MYPGTRNASVRKNLCVGTSEGRRLTTQAPLFIIHTCLMRTGGEWSADWSAKVGTWIGTAQAMTSTGIRTSRVS